MVARDMASTLLEVWELVSDATAADLEVHHESLCKCVVTMSVTVDDQKWCTLLGSLSTALKAQHDALALAAPTPDADIIASQRHLLYFYISLLISTNPAISIYLYNYI